MELYYAVCAGLVTLSTTLLSVVTIVTMLQLKKTAVKVEVLADNVNERVEQLRGITEIVAHFRNNLKSGWMRGAEAAFGIVQALRARFTERSETHV